MKTKMFASIVILVLLFPISVSFASDNIKIEDTYGTWVNTDYNTKVQFAKIICYADGAIAVYEKESDTEPKWIGKCVITNSWCDLNGNLWIKREVTYKLTGQIVKSYWLEKYCNDCTKREYVWSNLVCPTELSQQKDKYAIHYRL